VRGSLTGETDIDAWFFFLTPDLKWEGGANKAVLNEAGEELDEYVCEHLYRPKEGEVYEVPSFGAPVDKLYIGIMPSWKGGFMNEAGFLARCYTHLMDKLAADHVATIAMPSLGGGRKGFPQDRAVRVACQAMLEKFPKSLQEVRIVCLDQSSHDAWEERLSKLIQPHR
jgi:O-acetyl-ADP-ribose deacetylase (regulator of RNase III)